MAHFDKEKFRGMTFNGYSWVGYDFGVHLFTVKMKDGTWALIQCKEEQLFNGDIEFMTKHHLTLSKTEIKKETNKYKKRS